MSPITLLLGTLTGICIATGIIFLFTGLRRPGRDRIQILFALFAFSYAGANLTSVLEYKTDTLEEFMHLGDWTALFTVLTLLFLLWFVSAYTKVTPRIFLIGLTLVLCLVAVMAIANPTSVYSEISGIIKTTLPWGETITQVDASEGIWGIVFFLCQLILIGFLIFACAKQWRKGDRRDGIMLGLGLLFLVLALIFDMIFIDSGMINFVYLGDYGFIPLLLIMSLQLSNQVIETDEELDTYRQSLEQMVNERTQELEKTTAALQQSERQTRAMLDAPPDTTMLVTPDGDILATNQIGASRLGLKSENATGKNIFNYFEPDIAAYRKEKVQDIIRMKQPMEWEDQRGGRFFINRMYPVINEQDNVESVAIFAADITERKLTENNLRRRVEELRFLNLIASEISSQTNLIPTLQKVNEIITELFEAISTYIFYFVSDEQIIEVISGFDKGAGIQQSDTIRFQLNQLSFTQEVMKSGKGAILSDIDSLTIQKDIKNFLTENQINHMLLAPLLARGVSLGIIAVSAGNDRDNFETHDLELLAVIASYVAAAIENSQLIQDDIQTAAIEERSRLARDLHDAVTQTIYSASLIAEVLPQVWDRNPEEGKRNLTKLRALVRGALAEMRTMLFELRPSALEFARMETLLGQLGDALHGRTSIPVQVNCDDIPDLPTSVKVTFYRIAQEAVNNILKHAGASQTQIDLQEQSGQVSLRVWDNGRGFNTNKSLESGLGLEIMRERAEHIGAQLEIDSQPGHGTQVILQWVVEPSQDF